MHFACVDLLFKGIPFTLLQLYVLLLTRQFTRLNLVTVAFTFGCHAWYMVHAATRSKLICYGAIHSWGSFFAAAAQLPSPESCCWRRSPPPLRPVFSCSHKCRAAELLRRAQACSIVCQARTTAVTNSSFIYTASFTSRTGSWCSACCSSGARGAACTHACCDAKSNALTSAWLGRSLLRTVGAPQRMRMRLCLCRVLGRIKPPRRRMLHTPVARPTRLCARCRRTPPNPNLTVSVSPRYLLRPLAFAPRPALNTATGPTPSGPWA